MSADEVTEGIRGRITAEDEAILRDRVDSVYPGMVVHGLFNGLALAASVLS